jgi:hypothetical protein
MRVVAIDRFEYASKLRLPGDEFDTDNDEHARLLVLAQRVKYLETRDMKADTDKPKRYRTRALRAGE